MGASVRLFIADDQSLFLSGLEALLSLTNEFVVVGTARSSSEVLEHIDEQAIDVILLDIGLPDQSGIVTAEHLRKRGITTPILIVSNYDAKDIVLNAIEAGVQGYVLKDVAADTLRHAIRELVAGRRFIDSRILGFVMDAFVEITHREARLVLDSSGGGFKDARRRELSPSSTLQGPSAHGHSAHSLTPRELEVLRLMVAGFNNSEIANSLYMSPKTARNHTTNILQKLGVPDRTKAVVIALSEHLCELTRELGSGQVI